MDRCFINGNWWFFFHKKKMKKIIVFIPLLITLFISALLLYFLIQEKDSSVPPSTLINKKSPEFSMVDLFQDKQIFDNSIIKEKKVLINFFASWCAPCKVEHSLLMEISNENPNIIILGINYKDDKNDAIEFINKFGNPYSFIGIDDTGKIAMDFGVYGLPETIIINEKGIIIFKHVGPLTKKIYNEDIR